MQNRSMTAKEQETIFLRWLNDHAGIIFKVVRGSVAAAPDHDDLFQEVLLQLWLSVPSFRGEAKETTWIYRVAFNTALAWRRGERRRREGHERFLKYEPLPQAQLVHADSASEHEMIERLYAHIRALPKVDASLALMLLDGRSYQEMADVVGISENYVGVKLNRIRKELAEQMKGALHEL
jgi:RNA polymerase sigma-70 factor (ECF subfamily)